MFKSLSLSILFHMSIFAITFFTLPFVMKKPIDVPPIISVDLIQISEKTALPFAPKAREIIEKIKEEKQRIVTKQAPPKIIKKEKQAAIPMPDQLKKKKPKETDKQNPEEVKDEIRQSSEFEKKELFDPNKIAALIDKSKEETAEVQKKKSLEITQDEDSSVSLDKGLSITQEDAIKAQIFKCWNIPLGLPYNEDLTVRIRLKLNKDGSILNSEILDHVRMNRPGQSFYKVLAESALRAVRLCNPLKMPSTGHDKWKELQLNFDAKEMLKG